MLEVLVIGLVGLTYTCIQTLFFLNCLNSRRREQRRLEKVYRDSIRKIKGGVVEVRKKKQDVEKGVTVKSVKENGVCIKIENEVRSVNNKAISEESCEGQLVTRLVVNSGKEASPTSQEALTGSLCVRVQNDILQLSDRNMEGKHDLAIVVNEPLPQRNNETNLVSQDKNCSTLTVAPAGPQASRGFNITVNSNMIEVRDDGEPPLQHTEPIYESIGEEPSSILTQVTVCEEGDGRHKSLPRTTDVFREVQDIQDSCTTEDELAQTYRQLPRLPGTNDINLVNTISQILQSPPESLEPETENLPIESFDASPGFSPTNIVTIESHSSVSEGSERNDSSVTPGRNESEAGNSIVAECRQSGRAAGIWTLPRSGRSRPFEDYESLPRIHARMSIGRKAALYAPGSHTLPRPAGHTLPRPVSQTLPRPVVHTLPRPAAGHSTRRDETLLEGDPRRTHTLNTCHSRPAMAGAATTPIHTARAAFANDHSYNVVNGKTLSSNNSGSNTSVGDLEVTSHCEDYADSEESGDSLYFTASDRSNSIINNDMRRDSEEGTEPIIYETVETLNNPNKDKHSPVSIKLNASKQNETDSRVGNGPQEDRVEANPYDYHCDTYEEISRDSGIFNAGASKQHHDEDGESVGSGSQYENISESDTHGDSGYESPVKADVHSSDDAVSTASSTSSSSHDHHYEDIDPALMARAAGEEGRTRESTRRGRSQRDAIQRESFSSSSSRGIEDEVSSEAERHRQRLQGLDDLIAGVPPPDYDERQEPLSDASARPDVRSSGQQASIPPPPEFGDGSGRNVNGEISGRRQLHSTLSVPTTPSSSVHHHHQGRAPLTRTNSEPPPPPPMPSATPSPRTSPSSSHRTTQEVDDTSPASSKPSSPRSTHNPLEEREDEGPSEEAVVRPSEFIRRNSHRSENGSIKGHKKLDRPVSLPLNVAEHYGKIMSDGKDRDSVGSNEDLTQSPQLGKSHNVNGKTLPFIPPKFPTQPSDSGLIKPSEYLRSLGGNICRSPSNGDAKSPNGSTHVTDITLHLSDTPDNINNAAQATVPPGPLNINNAAQATVPPGPLPAIPEATEEELTKTAANTPPPPPAPPAPPASATNTLPSRNNTLTNSTSSNKTVLPTISVTDLQSVQLRKIETKVAKPTSVPLRVPITSEAAFTTAKNDVIAELKMGVDIPGIKKLKSERAKEEELHEKLEGKELSRQFSAVHFVDQVPEVDNAGNRIPDWKRQMLARKAAEKAKKEAEESRLQEAEEKRLQSIPPWKRQLLMKQTDDTKRGTLYIPKVEEVKKIKVINSPQDITKVLKKDSEKENTKPSPAPGNKLNSTTTTTTPKGSSPKPVNSSNTAVPKPGDSRHNDSCEEPRIPWRTNLRKTNSKLNLLE
nr:uncharacterized protein LOC123768680 [Procambarus clarkii]